MSHINYDCSNILDFRDNTESFNTSDCKYDENFVKFLILFYKPVPSQNISG